MVGNWKGYYKFENERIQKAIGFEKTDFEIIIENFDGINFDGIVNDDIKTGGMEETGEITGKIVNNKISFKKMMPVHNQIDAKGERKNIKGKHPVLYYYGTLSENETEIIGTWKFKKTLGFLFGVIPVFYRPGNGTWKMNLYNESK
ncbi:hypothetical protein [Flavobacterium hydatis]|uniref:Uncharacterized protein n=1 Tax=Flavobacterium hydatis TaxID=991 RepID=A0A086A081_FLAHY|nr:hypothetical protein [Flavobacterium hydatis]KFF10095.1 hypothetical protein IW20_21735 [Flavobacterium hydatis]OXA90354.1 hypothetical protein B0A62_20040 [Flavobacterium hydatis]